MDESQYRLKGINKLGRSYFIMLSSIIFLLLTSQVIVHYIINSQSQDAELINVAGRQRMLSQAIVKQKLAAQEATSPHTDLEILIEDFLSTHQQLSGGKYESNTEFNTEQINRKYDTLETAISVYRRLNTGEATDLELYEASELFLHVMNSIVAEYQYISESKLSQLRWIEVVLFAVTILTLFLEYRYLFIPLRRNLILKNQELEEKALLLEESNKFKSGLLINLDHEFRTPINAIENFTLFLKDAKNQEQKDEYSESIIRNTQRLFNTLSSIVNISRYSPEKEYNQNEEVTISSLFEELAKLHLTNSPYIIKVNDNLVIKSNLELIRTLFTHLLINSAKFSSGEKPIQVLNHFSDDTLTLVVLDEGIGISAEYIPEVTKAFTQESTGLTRKYEGMGLGLAISYQICKILGYQLEIKSEKGVGTEVSVHIPFSKVKEH